MTKKPVVSAESVPGEVLDALGKMRSPVVIAHIVPDADALGAMFALAVSWASDTCQPKVALPQGSLSQKLTFLFDWAEPQVATADDFERADGFIVVDTARKSRCNVGETLWESDWSAGRPVVNIDHHATNKQYGDVNWVIGESSSTCEMVYYLLKAANKPIDSITASLIYAGIQTDTLGFSLPTTTPSCLRATADVIEAGANLTELGERLCRSQRKSEFDLLRIVYDNTEVLAEGKVAYSFASYDDIHGAGCTASDIDDQINIPRSLAGVRLAMLFTEGHKGKTRINFRGSGGVTVVELAGEFNGGGHSESAGAVLDCGLEEGIAQVLPRAIEHIKKF
ncbi:MAG: bifunctional oligoribonuclease/PAP phosphatase NrnA [Phycisphaerales bacterium]|nr:MAG: bifunctional oligoribonuclease/PAP phosphatase NrnA [Phycisphaerales bacterium]